MVLSFGTAVSISLSLAGFSFAEEIVGAGKKKQQLLNVVS